MFYAFVYQKPTAEHSVGGKEELMVESGCSEINVNLGVMRDEDKEGLQIYYKLLKDKKLIVFLLASFTFTAVALMPPIFMVSVLPSFLPSFLLSFTLSFLIPS